MDEGQLIGVAGRQLLNASHNRPSNESVSSSLTRILTNTSDEQPTSLSHLIAGAIPTSTNNNGPIETDKLQSTINLVANQNFARTSAFGPYSGSQFSDKSSLGGDNNYGYLISVRSMIAQHQLEFIFVCVILIYLVYYFTRISGRPKFIGNPESELSKFIKSQLSDILESRFNPLIYFWGTNPQTALFGYLQGQSSMNEVPRDRFRRQYLYISDAQYLTSNVDLSDHYRLLAGKQQTNRKQRRPTHKRSRGTRLESIGHRQTTTATLTGAIKRKRVLELRVNESLLQQESGDQLNQNIRLALDGLLANDDQKTTTHTETSKHVRSTKGFAFERSSSSDSGVSASHSLTSSSTSSLADITLERPSKSSAGSSGSSSGSSTSDRSSHRSSSGGCRCEPSSLDVSLITGGDSLSSEVQQRQQQQHLPSDGNMVPEVLTPPLETPIMVHQTINGRQMDHDHAGGVLVENFQYGQCALDWYTSSHANYHKNKLVALISAGMTTGSDKKYVTDTVITLERLGYEVCVFIRRGVGGLKLSSAKFFSPAKWRDFEAAVMSVRRQRPNANLVAIGFSFGSIELCRYLAMSSRKSLVDAALLVSCPFDPEAGGRNMRKRALNRRIDAYLARNLGKQLYEAIAGSMPLTSGGHPQQGLNSIQNYNGSIINLASLPKIKSLVDFEDNYNRVIQNYPNSDAYAADSRLHNHIGAIETPTLCISSEDDFMAPLKLLPLDEIRASKNVCMILTKRGGHMAFIDGLLSPKKPYFAQRIIGRYMESVKGTFFATDSPSNCSSSSNCLHLESASQEKKNTRADSLGQFASCQLPILPVETVKGSKNGSQHQVIEIFNVK